jgi:predicted oxidoreductase
MLTNLGFGGSSLSSLSSFREASLLLNTAFDLGIRHYDTAPLYGQGYSELIIGKVFKNKRADISITTKFGLGDSKPIYIPVQVTLPLNYYKKKVQKNEHQTSTTIIPSPQTLAFRKVEAAQIEKSIYESLKRLKTDYVDYFLLHEGAPSFLDEKAMSVLSSLKKRGIVKNIGIATNYFNIALIPSDILLEWDILQYEVVRETSGIFNFIPTSSDKVHFLHSVLKKIKRTQKEYDPKLAAQLLFQAVEANPKGKVLFSTRSIQNLLKSIEEFVNYL